MVWLTQDLLFISYLMTEWKQKTLYVFRIVWFFVEDHTVYHYYGSVLQIHLSIYASIIIMYINVILE